MRGTCRWVSCDTHGKLLFRSALSFAFASGLVPGLPGVASADPATSSREEPDQYELRVQGETHAALFQRALLPGANGALVTTDTIAPIRQYVLLRARDIDAPWAKDSVDTELSAWGNVAFGNIGDEHVLDGDVQAANVGYRQGPLSFRLGRQHVAGGAARYARFDGASAEAQLGIGLTAQVYGGFTVLPRWNERPGYHFLGAAADSDLKNPNALPPLSRSSHYLFGGRVGYRAERFSGGLSLHDQWERGGLSRFDLGLDGRAEISDSTRAGANAVLDADARRFADVRLFLDTEVARPLDFSLEYLHTEPALLLSRQSVLSVFSTDSYDEVGGVGTLRVTPLLSLEQSGFAQVYDTGRAGARAESVVRVVTDRTRSTTLRVGYARVQAPLNGYHSIRTSLYKRITERMSGTLEAYGYVYDELISGMRTSSVYAGTLSADAARGVRVLLGTSLASSPYAALDAQVQARLSLDLDLAPRRRVQ